MNLYLNYLLFSPAVVPDILSQVVASHAENEVVAGSLDQLDQHLQKLVVFLVKSVIREIRYAQNFKYYKRDKRDVRSYFQERLSTLFPAP